MIKWSELMVLNISDLMFQTYLYKIVQQQQEILLFSLLCSNNNKKPIRETKEISNPDYHYLETT